MATIRRSNWRTEVIAADPDWARDAYWHVEYKFSASAGEDREFKADYRHRGAYHDEPPGD